jgi:hypothetical protein
VPINDATHHLIPKKYERRLQYKGPVKTFVDGILSIVLRVYIIYIILVIPARKTDRCKDIGKTRLVAMYVIEKGSNRQQSKVLYLNSLFYSGDHQVGVNGKRGRPIYTVYI